MAQVNFAPDVASISGKLCSRSGIVYAVNKQTGKTHRLDRHGYTDLKSEAQIEVRTTFKKKASFASSWWQKNKPSAQNAQGTESYRLLMKAYKGQHKIGNPYSYMRSLITTDLKVMLGDLDITGTISLGGSSSDTGGGTTNPGGDSGLDG